MWQRDTRWTRDISALRVKAELLGKKLASATDSKQTFRWLIAPQLQSANTVQIDPHLGSPALTTSPPPSHQRV